MNAEIRRLQESHDGTAGWKNWGPYLSERQWGTVREDYSEGGNAWDYFSHDQARSRAYRWGEDGLAGISDRPAAALFRAGALERQGPDPQGAAVRADQQRRQSRRGREGVLLLSRLHADPLVHEVPLQVSAGGVPVRRAGDDQSPDAAGTSSNTNCSTRACSTTTAISTSSSSMPRPRRRHPDRDHRRQSRAGSGDVACAADAVVPQHLVVGRATANCRPSPADADRRRWRWSRRTDPKLGTRYLLLRGRAVAAVHRKRNQHRSGCSASPQRDAVREGRHQQLRRAWTSGRGESGSRPARRSRRITSSTFRAGKSQHAAAAAERCRSRRASHCTAPFGRSFDDVDERTPSARRTSSTRSITPPSLNADARPSHAAGAGRDAVEQAVLLLRRRQVARRTRLPIRSEPTASAAPRNDHWHHMYNADVISMPDKWEYPWYAAWDLAFHVLALTLVDPDFGKQQLDLMLREHYMHPNGQIPAYEWNFGDVNPPVHAWATIFTYRLEKARPARATCAGWSAASRSCCSTSPGGSTARTARARTSSRAASSGSTTSASSIAARRCRPAAISNRPTAPPGWRSSA